MFPPVRRPPADTTGASRRELNFDHAPNCSKARAISVPPGRKAHIAESRRSKTCGMLSARRAHADGCCTETRGSNSRNPPRAYRRGAQQRAPMSTVDVLKNPWALVLAGAPTTQWESRPSRVYQDIGTFLDVVLQRDAGACAQHGAAARRHRIARIIDIRVGGLGRARRVSCQAAVAGARVRASGAAQIERRVSSARQRPLRLAAPDILSHDVEFLAARPVNWRAAFPAGDDRTTACPERRGAAVFRVRRRGSDRPAGRTHSATAPSAARGRAPFRAGGARRRRCADASRTGRGRSRR